MRWSQTMTVHCWPGFRSVKCSPDGFLKVMLGLEMSVLDYAADSIFARFIWSYRSSGPGKLIVERT